MIAALMSGGRPEASQEFEKTWDPPTLKRPMSFSHIVDGYFVKWKGHRAENGAEHGHAAR